jgi:hypothetical protein
MKGLFPMMETKYDILIDDADGKHLYLESVQDLETARQRLTSLASSYPGTRLILREQKTRAILAATEGY